MHVKSASFCTDNGQTSRFSFSYRISDNKNFIPKYLDTLLRFCLNFTNIMATVLEKNAPVNDFVRFPVPRIIAEVKQVMGSFHCYDSSNVIATLMMTNFHLNTTDVAIFSNVCLWRRSLCSDLVLTLKHCIEPPSYARTAYVFAIWPSFLFDSFAKIWAT